MKKLLFILFLGATFSLQAQNFSEIKKTKMTTLEEYQAQNDNVLECARYILDRSISEISITKKGICTKFIFEWMTGIDITFNLDETMSKLTKGDTDRMVVYLAAMAVAALEDPDNKPSAEEITERAKELFLDYAEDEDNNLKLNRYIKKQLKARKK